MSPPLLRSTCTHDDVLVDDVGGAADGEKSAMFVASTRSELDDIGRRLSHQAGESHC
jgi:hypothetical protein